MFIISNIFAGNINGERYRAEILTPFLNELHDDEFMGIFNKMAQQRIQLALQ
jgi:hypothetical protein